MSKEMQQQFDGMKAEMAGMGRRLDGIDHRLEGVEHRLDGVEHRLDGVEHRLDGVEQRLGSVESTLHNVVVEQARARGDIEWLRGNSVTRDEYKSGVNLILNRLDGLAGMIEDSRYGSAKNVARLDDHEKRISALEDKRA
jgi:hypothetical protein